MYYKVRWKVKLVHIIHINDIELLPARMMRRMYCVWSGVCRGWNIISCWTLISFFWQSCSAISDPWLDSPGSPGSDVQTSVSNSDLWAMIILSRVCLSLACKEFLEKKFSLRSFWLFFIRVEEIVYHLQQWNIIQFMPQTISSSSSKIFQFHLMMYCSVFRLKEHVTEETLFIISEKPSDQHGGEHWNQEWQLSWDCVASQESSSPAYQTDSAACPHQQHHCCHHEE